MRALVVVDVQNDFCEGGSLPVAGGAEVAAAAARLVNAPDRPYDVVVATRDRHVDPGPHFSDHPDFATSWPVHCVAGTPGADFHPAFEPVVAGGSVAAVFDKGAHAAAYSGFEGHDLSGTPLGAWLREHGVDDVHVVGIATDHCVAATALDAAAEGFPTTVLLDLTAGVAQASTDAALERMREAGITLRGTPIVRAA